MKDKVVIITGASQGLGRELALQKDWLVYTASKWAITGFSKALRYHLSSTKIKVSEFFPSGFESNIFENAGDKEAHNQPWMMRTEDVAKTIVYALYVPMIY